MQEHVGIPPSRAYPPWRPRVLVGLSVIAALVLAGVTGVGVGIVLGAIAVADIAGVAVVTVVRAYRYREPLHVAAAAMLLTERDRSRLAERSHRNADRTNPSDPSS